MPNVRATDRPVYWAVGGDVVEAGTLDAGGLLLTGLPLFSANDENDFLFSVVGKAGDYSPLPNAGEWCEAGEIYGYSGDLVMCRQSHTRTEHVPSDIPALFAVYRADAGDALDWIVGEQVYIGTRRLYDDVLYSCLQAHQTQTDWYPSASGILGVLWSVVPTVNEWEAGVAYIGDNTAGAGNGDVVLYVPNGHQYRCLQSHTSIVTWYPPIVPALWLDLGA